MAFGEEQFSTVSFAGPPQITYPMPAKAPGHMRIRQQCMVLAQNYTGCELDSQHYLYPHCYATADENHSLNGRMLRFTRVYLSVPGDVEYREPSTVTFPAIGGSTTGESFTVTDDGGFVRQHYSDIIPRTGELTMTVPVLRKRHYFIPGLVGGFASLDEVPMEVRFRQTDSSGLPIVDLEVALATPDADQYKAWVQNGYYICVEPTVIYNYQGNLYYTQTGYARAR